MIISKDSIVEQSKAMANYTQFMINIMIGGSAIIAVSIHKMVMDIFVGEYGIVLPLEMKPSDMAKGLLILIVIFLAGTYTSRKKIEKIPLQEVLKTYSE